MGQNSTNLVTPMVGLLFGFLAVSIAGCASPAKSSVANVAQSSLATTAPPIVSTEESESSVPTLKIRYPAIISEEVRAEYNQKLAYQRLGYTWDNLEKQTKYEKSAKLQPTENYLGVSINEINLMSIARSGVTAAMVYDRAKEVLPGTILLEPLEIRRNASGGFVGVPIDGAPLPPAKLELDLTVYSHPNNESFSGKAIPLVTLRPGLSEEPPFYIASDGLASAKGLEGSAGYTLIDYLSAANPNQVCLRVDGCLDYEHQVLEAGTPIVSRAPHVLPLEKINFGKGNLRKFLEGKDSTENPMLERFIDPLLWRVHEVLEIRPSSGDEANAIQEYAAFVFTPEDTEYLKATIGEDVFTDMVSFIHDQELELLSADSDMIRRVTLESDYAMSVNELIIQEVKFEQRQEMMNTLAFATAFVGAGAAFSQVGTQAAQSIMSTTNVMVSGFSQANINAQDNFTLVFSPLLNEERTARQYKIYGGEREISATTIADYRSQQAETILNDVRSVYEKPAEENHSGGIS